MYTLNVPLYDSNDYLKSSLHNFNSVSTVNSPEKGGRMVNAASLQVTQVTVQFPPLIGMGSKWLRGV
jgi:hypothetical protein